MRCKNCGTEIIEGSQWCSNCGAIAPNNSENNNIKEIMNNQQNQDEYDKRFFYISNIVIYFILILTTIICSKGLNLLSIIIILMMTIYYFYNFCFEKLLIKDGIGWWKEFIPVYSNYIYYKLCLDDTKLFWVTFFGPLAIVILLVISQLILQKFTIIVVIISALFGVFTIVLQTYMLYRLGKKFGKNGVLSGVLTLLFPLILIPILAFKK